MFRQTQTASSTDLHISSNARNHLPIDYRSVRAMSVQELTSEAETLGYKDTEEIREYVRKRQQQLRDDRAQEREFEKLKLEHEKEKRLHEKEMLQLKLSQPQTDGTSSPGVNPVAHTQFSTHRLNVPKYEVGQAIEPFIDRFQMVATTYKLSEDVKKVEFMNLFDGKPLDIIHRLDSSMRDYEGMKKALLLAYGKTLEDARDQYQRAMLQDKETVAQFCARLKSYLDHWMEKDETPQTVEGLRDLMLRTQLEKSCPTELVAKFKTQKVKDLQQMTDLADAHFAAYGYHTRKQLHKKLPPPVHSQTPQGQPQQVRNQPYSQGGWKGHKGQKNQHAAAAAVHHGGAPEVFSPKVIPQEECVTAGSVSTPQHVYLSAALSSSLRGTGLLVQPGKVNGVTAEVLRDNGSTGCCVKERLVTPDSYTGNYVTVSLINGTRVICPLATAHTKTPPKPVQRRLPEEPPEQPTSEDVVAEQTTDPTLAMVCKKVLEGHCRTSRGTETRFLKKRGRLYRSTVYPSGDSRLQFVVPEKYRLAVFKLGHHAALGGHMGRVAVDIVGPIIPRAADGAKYTLTCVGFATRWSEAVPLRNIETITVAEAMFEIFCRVGIPKQVLSDRGSQFTSVMMEELLRLLAKTKLRILEEGDQCPLLLPTAHNKLLSQWQGPFEVVKRLNDLNYLVQVGPDQKRFHINMLKKYYTPQVTCSAVGQECLLNRGDRVLSPEQYECLQIVEGQFKQSQMVSAAVVIPEVEELTDCAPLTREAIQGETVEDVQVPPRLGPEQKRRINSILQRHSAVFSDKPGVAKVDCHEIRLTSSVPVRLKPYPIPIRLVDAVKKEIDNMEAAGIIEKSSSPYCSPIVVVRKKYGGVRICGDYRGVNAVTQVDAEPMSNQQEIFAKAANSKIFSKMDLAKGFFQIPLEERSKQVTAVAIPNGLYQFKVLPFGLTNSPAVFNRAMRQVLRGIHGVEAFVDNILIHSSTFEEHLEILEKVLKRLSSVNMTVKPSKCELFQQEVQFLGHTLGEGRCGCQDSKIMKIKNASRPTTKKQVRSFLGLVGYYRRFIPNFAVLALPLTELLNKNAPNKLTWRPEQEEAFTTLKNLLCKEPILQLPGFNQPFILRTDASQEGIGAILMQERDGDIFPVSYHSRKLKPAEWNYSTVEKELLAVVEGIKKYYYFLYGDKFILETDHLPLSSLRTSKNANARIMRWALYLQQFNVVIRYIKGSSNVGADLMSRLLEKDVKV
ncbi:uncharacterized protein LOC143028970 [Oratosquilla oratoria]|uniref:uncharacterized protein LOC143028970 n=1 Tax=Oratosquilla oratoria TaxID=337810 RepID=UPI003F7655C3